MDAAESLLNAFVETISTLERYLDRGSIPKELEALGVREFRRILLDPHRIIGSKVVIVVIADSRRDMQALLKRRLLGL